MSEQKNDLPVDVYQVTEKARHCEFCRFVTHESMLLCHRRSPVVDVERNQTRWPPVQPWDWCGDFEVDRDRWQDAIQRYPWLREDK